MKNLEKKITQDKVFTLGHVMSEVGDVMSEEQIREFLNNMVVMGVLTIVGFDENGETQYYHNPPYWARFHGMQKAEAQLIMLRDLEKFMADMDEILQYGEEGIC